MRADVCEPLELEPGFGAPRPCERDLRLRARELRILLQRLQEGEFGGRGVVLSLQRLDAPVEAGPFAPHPDAVGRDAAALAVVGRGGDDLLPQELEVGGCAARSR